VQSAPDDKIREAWRNLPVDVSDRLVNSYAVHDCEGIAQTAYRQGFEDGYRAGKKAELEDKNDGACRGNPQGGKAH